MNRKWRCQPFCLMLLLFAETVQGLTPDPVSLASTRLLRVINSLVEQKSSLSTGILSSHPASLLSHATLPPSNSVPHRHSEHEEVCLASFATAARLAVDLHVHAGRGLNSLSPRAFPVWHGQTEPPLAGGETRSLLHSLCRLTC